MDITTGLLTTTIVSYYNVNVELDKDDNLRQELGNVDKIELEVKVTVYHDYNTGVINEREIEIISSNVDIDGLEDVIISLIENELE